MAHRRTYQTAPNRLLGTHDPDPPPGSDRCGSRLRQVHRPGDLPSTRRGAPLGSRRTRRRAPSAPWVGIDDLHELTPAEQLRLTTAVAALPPATRVAVASRVPLAAE